MIKRLTAIAQSPLGRAIAVLTGLGIVSALVYRSGPALVLAAVTRTPSFFLIVLLLEIGVAGTEAWGAVVLYDPERNKISYREALRVSMFCYSLIGVLPFGRAAGETARAAMFSRYVGVPLAAASAARMQALSLIANAFISVPCAIAVYLMMGPSLLLLGVVVGFVLTAGLGGGMLAAGKAGAGAKISKLFRVGSEMGAAVDQHLKADVALASPLAWTCLSRVLRVGQRITLLAAVGAAVGLLPALLSESINQVASTVGDAIPGQVGITEAGYALAATTLRTTESDAIAMALLVHFAQVICVGLGFLSPLLARNVVTQEAR